MARFAPLSSTAQTAYAQLLDAVHAAELARTVADLPGTFARKQVKGRNYWYYQYLDLAGVRRQIYIGPENERVAALIARRAEGGARPALQALAQSAEALGNAPMLPRHFKVVQRLADYGFFRAGGVLVGTHAFLAFGNMLGVRWQDGQRTQDVDFAHAGKAIALALPSNIEIDTHAAIESLQMGLLPIEHSDGGTGATYLDAIPTSSSISSHRCIAVARRPTCIRNSGSRCSRSSSWSICCRISSRSRCSPAPARRWRTYRIRRATPCTNCSSPANDPYPESRSQIKI